MDKFHNTCKSKIRVSTIRTWNPIMSQQQAIQNFMQGFTAETTPGSAAKIADFREHLRPGTVVYITFLPGSDFADTVSVAKRLRNEGFIPVPHFAARSIASLFGKEHHGTR